MPVCGECSMEHHQKPLYHIPSHKVKTFKNTPLYELIQKRELSVNSYHHQGIFLSDRRRQYENFSCFCREHKINVNLRISNIFNNSAGNVIL